MSCSPTAFSPTANTLTTAVTRSPTAGWASTSPDSLSFQEALADCKTVIWNGRWVVRVRQIRRRTNGVAHTLAELSGTGAAWHDQWRW